MPLVIEQKEPGVSKRFDIRATWDGDRSALLDMYPLAFPDEYLRDLVCALLDQPDGVLSLGGFVDQTLVAHVMLSDVRTAPDGPKGALLGPLAVHPDHQRQGWGRAIVARGEAVFRAAGGAAVYLLGDPAYYSRLGYSQEDQVMPPYPLPDGWATAWQSHQLGDEQLAPGPVEVPDPWRVRAYWSD